MRSTDMTQNPVQTNKSFRISFNLLRIRLNILSNLIGFILPAGPTHQYWWSFQDLFWSIQAPTKLKKMLRIFRMGIITYYHHFSLSNRLHYRPTNLCTIIENTRFFGSLRPIFKHRNLVINDPIEFVENGTMAQKQYTKYM